MKKHKKRESLLLWALKTYGWFMALTVLFAAALIGLMTEAEAKTIESTPPPQEQKYDVPLSDELQSHIKNVCEMYELDVPLTLAVIGMESNYRCEAVGDNGESYGLMQIQPKWHKARMDRLGVTDLMDPYQNVLVGIDILAEKVHKNKGYEWALMAYNSGHQQADFNKNIGVISEYAETVLKIKEDIENGNN